MERRRQKRKEGEEEERGWEEEVERNLLAFLFLAFFVYFFNKVQYFSVFIFVNLQIFDVI